MYYHQYVSSFFCISANIIPSLNVMACNFSPSSLLLCRAMQLFQNKSHVLGLVFLKLEKIHESHVNTEYQTVNSKACHVSWPVYQTRIQGMVK